MKQIVYLDVLFGINLLVNFFLLLTVNGMHRLHAKNRRLILGSGLGALYALIIFFPELNVWLFSLVKLVLAASIVAVTFGRQGKKMFLKTLAGFYLVNFLFAGLMFALWVFISPAGMAVNNGVVYFHTSPLFLLVASFVCFGVVTIIGRLVRHRVASDRLCQLEITVDRHKQVLTALADTGNSLSEMFSDTPVIVAEYDAIKSLLPEQFEQMMEIKGDTYDASLLQGFRVVPYTAVGKTGVLPAFRPDCVKLTSEKKTLADVYVAVCNQRLSGGEYNAIMNPEILEMRVQ